MGDKYLRALKTLFAWISSINMSSVRNIQMFKYGKIFPFGFFTYIWWYLSIPDIFLSYHHCNFTNSFMIHKRKKCLGRLWLTMTHFLTLFLSDTLCKKRKKTKGYFDTSWEKYCPKGQLFIYFLSKLFERGRLICKAFLATFGNFYSYERLLLS